MKKYSVKYSIDIGDGLVNNGEYITDILDAKDFVDAMKRWYGDKVHFDIRRAINA